MKKLNRTKTDKFVPMLEGRSSVGRLGLSIKDYLLKVVFSVCIETLSVCYK